MYLLCVYPDTQKRLREEVRGYLGKDGHLDHEGLKDLKYRKYLEHLDFVPCI